MVKILHIFEAGKTKKTTKKATKKGTTTKKTSTPKKTTTPKKATTPKKTTTTKKTTTPKKPSAPKKSPPKKASPLKKATTPKKAPPKKAPPKKAPVPKKSPSKKATTPKKAPPKKSPPPPKKAAPTLPPERRVNKKDIRDNVFDFRIEDYENSILWYTQNYSLRDLRREQDDLERKIDRSLSMDDDISSVRYDIMWDIVSSAIDVLSGKSNFKDEAENMLRSHEKMVKRLPLTRKR